jgi:hypothetical protein
VVSVIVTLLSDPATTFNPEIVDPEANVPNDPAFVVHVGAVDTDKSALVDLTAPPSLFSILIKYDPAAKLNTAAIEDELEKDTVTALVIAPVELFIASTTGTD